MLNKKIHNKTELRDQINLLLNNRSLKNPLTESQIIISYSANTSNYIDVKFEDIDFQMIDHIISQRITGKPLSKIIKQKGFWKDIFYTDENTLDPRSDSEILIECIIQDFNSLKNPKFEFIDLCCGSGCLGISLLREFKSSTCDFIDISRPALLNCKKNIFDLAVDSRSKLYESDLFENYPISKIKNIKFIICNPPYIPTNQYYALDKETLHDPRISLDGGVKGLDFYIKILNFIETQPFKGDIYFEIDPAIVDDFEKFLLEKSIKIVYKKQDYLNLDRLLKITLP
ncbi:peptide chain release factor N(5)-glutamine methyltransferase [Alphaproteobacteria bacterium]|nr:peptide chain release factor N(5)-glutamine methyltransferase [Alphaproteobacteria bacterium]